LHIRLSVNSQYLTGDVIILSAAGIVCKSQLRQQHWKRHLTLPHCPSPALSQLRGHDHGELIGRERVGGGRGGGEGGVGERGREE